VPKSVQMKFAPPSISNHCVGVQVNYTLCFRETFEQVKIFQVVVIGVVGGPNIGVFNEGGRQMESRAALCGSSLHSNHSKVSDITAGKLSV